MHLKEPYRIRHDLDGNLTSDGTWTYTWNADEARQCVDGAPQVCPKGCLERVPFGQREQQNRLKSATDGVVTIDFEYDYQGRLVEKDDGTSVEVYIYDGNNRIAKYINGSFNQNYLWGMDLSASMQGAGGVGGLLKEGSLYPTYDANGNITQKVDASGLAVMTVEYDPFGNIINGSLVGGVIRGQQLS